MINKKVLFTSLLILVLAMVVYACSSSPSNQGGNSGNSGNTNSTTGNQTPAAGGQDNEVKPTLRLLHPHGSNINPATDPLVTEMEEITGYSLEYSMLPPTDANERLSIEIASGSDYDIVKLTPPQYYMLVSQGALLPLDELLDKHGQNLLNAITPESWDLAKYEGSIYGIPQKNERENLHEMLRLRADILEELDLDIPNTADELHQVLRAVKQNYPDMIPLSAFGKDIDVIYSAFGLFTEWIDTGDEVLPRILMPQIKDYMAYMVMLYDEGLLDADWPINSTPTTEEKFISGKAFMIDTYWSPAVRVSAGVDENLPDAKLAWVPPLADANGNRGIQADVRMNYFTAIPRASNHPEHAMQYLDAKLEKDNFTQLSIGKEGETFNLVDGKYIPINPLFTEQRNNAFWYLNGVDEYRYPDMWLARLHRNPYLLEAYEQMEEVAGEYKMINITSLMPPLEGVSRNIQALTQMEEDYFIQVLLGEASLDNFDQFITNWRNSGGDEMVQTVNEWYRQSN